MFTKLLGSKRVFVRDHFWLAWSCFVFHSQKFLKAEVCHDLRMAVLLAGHGKQSQLARCLPVYVSSVVFFSADLLTISYCCTKQSTCPSRPSQPLQCLQQSKFPKGSRTSASRTATHSMMNGSARRLIAPGLAARSLGLISSAWLQSFIRLALTKSSRQDCFRIMFALPDHRLLCI